MRLLLRVALAASLSTYALAADGDGTKPDDRITPGEIRTTDREEICSTRTGSVRNVSETTKIAVRRAYGHTNGQGWCGTHCDEEIDHRVPLVVGGGNTPGSIKNLWEQRGDGPHGYHVKDVCEDRVGRALCSGKITVTEAQAIFLGDWTVGCEPYLRGRRD